jgi:hypothetical protein
VKDIAEFEPLFLNLKRHKPYTLRTCLSAGTDVVTSQSAMTYKQVLIAH